MANLLTSTEQIVRLSSIDQSTPRYYIRLALCFENNESSLRDIIDRVTPAIKQTVKQFPVLAGIVRPATDGANTQERRLEIVTTVDRVISFKPIMKSVVGLNVKSYEALSAASMPSAELINGLMAPLPDTPGNEEVPAFAMQVNSIDGGYVVALYLHHCVGDIATLRMITEHISGDLSARELTPKDLKEYVTEQSILREALSSSRGYKSAFAKLVRFSHVKINETQRLMTQVNLAAPNNNTCLFSFNIKLLDEVKSIVNARASEIREWQTPRVVNAKVAEILRERPSIQVTTHAILTAILWKAITRARVSIGMANIDENDFKLQSATLFDYVNLRSTIDSSIDTTYVGNALLEVFATQSIHKLAMPMDPSGIGRAARAITTAQSSAFEGRVRSTIAAINETTSVEEVEVKGMLLSSDLAIMNWSDLDLEKATLNLGLGAPGWARQMGTSGNSFMGCIVHTKREEEGLWDVMVQLPLPTMQRLSEDPGFMEFAANFA